MSICKYIKHRNMAVWLLDSWIPLEEEEQPSNIPGGIFWLSSTTGIPYLINEDEYLQSVGSKLQELDSLLPSKKLGRDQLR